MRQQPNVTCPSYVIQMYKVYYEERRSYSLAVPFAIFMFGKQNNTISQSQFKLGPFKIRRNSHETNGNGERLNKYINIHVWIIILPYQAPHPTRPTYGIIRHTKAWVASICGCAELFVPGSSNKTPNRRFRALSVIYRCSASCALVCFAFFVQPLSTERLRNRERARLTTDIRNAALDQYFLLLIRSSDQHAHSVCRSVPFYECRKARDRTNSDQIDIAMKQKFKSKQIRDSDEKCTTCNFIKPRPRTCRHQVAKRPRQQGQKYRLD